MRPEMRHQLCVICLTGVGIVLGLSVAKAVDRPNVLWITSEDNGPQLGAYGDKYAVTPNLDALAARGVRYTRCWSNAPVCAPARTVIISGMWAPSLGAEHMRSQVRMPENFLMYPAYLRQAGYYCTNNSKTDYNVELTGRVWDESSNRAHWRNRPAGQPFFAIFNHTISHESQIRNAINNQDRIHDPAKAPLPAYHPDTPEVRQDWAQYYDRLTMMDRAAGENLKELEDAGLADDTIVFYYGDHGSGMPRSKRWPYNSGLHVPLIVYVPPKWRHLAPPELEAGAASDRPVSFYDLAPTLLSVCGVKPPSHMHGRAFLGEYAEEAPRYQFGFRGRMDERYDLVRTCRDDRFVYIRNFMPHEIYGQYVEYMFQTPTTRVWKERFDRGQLNAAQSKFWQAKPPEELYDLHADPSEVNNLAESPEHQATLVRMRDALREQLLTWRDVGFLPEGEIHTRAGDDAPWTMAQDDARYPMQKILAMAEKASFLDPQAVPQLVEGLNDVDSAVRYWAALGLLMRGKSAVEPSRAALRRALEDEAAPVRVTAVEALARYGAEEDLNEALTLLATLSDLRRYDTFTAMLALNSLQALGDKAAPVASQVAALPAEVNNMPPRVEGYVARLLEKFRSDFSDAASSPQPSSKKKQRKLNP